MVIIHRALEICGRRYMAQMRRRWILSREGGAKVLPLVSLGRSRGFGLSLRQSGSPPPLLTLDFYNTYQFAFISVECVSSKCTRGYVTPVRYLFRKRRIFRRLQVLRPSCRLLFTCPRTFLFKCKISSY